MATRKRTWHEDMLGMPLNRLAKVVPVWNEQRLAAEAVCRRDLSAILRGVHGAPGGQWAVMPLPVSCADPSQWIIRNGGNTRCYCHVRIVRVGDGVGYAVELLAEVPHGYGASLETATATTASDVMHTVTRLLEL